VAGLVPTTVTPWPKSSSHADGFGGGAHVWSAMSQRAPVSLSEQPMFFDGETKKTPPVPTNAGTNVVVVVDGALDEAAEEEAGPLEPGDFEAESEPPHAPTNRMSTIATSPSHRAIHETLGELVSCAAMGDVVGLHQVAQHVEDLDRAVRFYQDVLGLRLIARFDPPGLAFFALGDTRLLLETGAPSALLYLRVDDPAAALERLREQGVTIEQDAHVIFADADGQFGDPGENEVMGFFRDSEENLVAYAARLPV